MRRFYIPDWLPGHERRWRKRNERFMASLTPEQKASLQKVSRDFAESRGVTLAEALSRVERALGLHPDS